MNIKILEQGADTTKLKMNGATYRITKETATVSRFFVSQWPYALDTSDWLDFVDNLRSENKTVYYEVFGDDIDATYNAVLDIAAESWDGDEAHPLEWYDVFVGER
jgi:hypothetical protein